MLSKIGIFWLFFLANLGYLKFISCVDANAYYNYLPW